LRWPDGWTIEDAVGWILDGQPDLAESIEGIEPAPADTPTLVARLKLKDRDAGGLKQDRVACESVAQAIGGSTACRSRGLTLLNALASECLGIPSDMFAEREVINGMAVRVFTP